MSEIVEKDKMKEVEWESVVGDGLGDKKES